MGAKAKTKWRLKKKVAKKRCREVGVQKALRKVAVEKRRETPEESEEGGRRWRIGAQDKGCKLEIPEAIPAGH